MGKPTRYLISVAECTIVNDSIESVDFEIETGGSMVIKRDEISYALYLILLLLNSYLRKEIDSTVGIRLFSIFYFPVCPKQVAKIESIRGIHLIINQVLIFFPQRGFSPFRVLAHRALS